MRRVLVMLSFILSITVFGGNLKRPNIILIYADDLGYGDLGCYGQTLIQTPNLDRMAKEGIQLTRFYTASPVCAPSRCSLMTGKHGGHSYVRNNANVLPMGQIPIPEEEFTIAELLKTNGYNTGGFGKWSLGAPDNSGDPLRQGFDYFFGYYCQCYAHNYFPEILWRNKDTVRLKNETVPVKVNFIQYPLSYAIKKVEYSPNVIFDDAMKFIEQNRENPFFLYYATTLPHSNGEAPKEEQFEILDWGIYKDMPWTPQEKGYAAMISLLDKQVGDLIQKLKELGIAENTLIVFTSDNGPTNFAKVFISSADFKGRKTDLYEGGILEPFIAWWPDRIPPGQVSSMPAAMYDLMPTFAEVSGLPKPKTSDGRSILPTMMNKRQKPADYLYWDFYEGERNPKQAIRQGDWKLLRFNFTSKELHEIELYNLKKDPGELNNVAANNPKLVKKLVAIMDQQHTDYQFEGKTKR